MTVEELIETLQSLPPTAFIDVQSDEDQDWEILDIAYDLGRVVLRLTPLEP